VDRPRRRAHYDAAVRADPRRPPTFRTPQGVAGVQQARLDDLAERNAGLGLSGAGHIEVREGDRDDTVDPRSRQAGVTLVTLDPDEPSSELLRDRSGRADAEEGIDDNVAGFRRG